MPGPTRRASLWVPPKPGVMPRPTSGCPNTALSEQMRKSQLMESSHPPPRAKPFTAATVGRGNDSSFKKTSLPFIDSRDLLIKGIDDAAVINLFEDAHWATGATRYASEGYIERYKYNVSKTTSSQYDMMSPRTISYVITFKNPSQLDYFTLDLLDPFIIVEYMGTYMEVHAVYRYRSNTALHEYVQPNVAVILPWALTVPDGSFRYPLDGVNIGFAKDGALFGAYMTGGHSFGEWASNRLQAIDWYYYPTANQVY